MLGGPSPRSRPWVVIAALGLVGWFCVSFPSDYNAELPAELESIGVAVVFVAVVIWFLAYREIRLLRPVDSLVMSGIYAHTRNPVYLSAIIAVIGGALYSRRLLALVWVLASFLILHWMAKQEERELERAYGEVYRKYKASVPLLVPKL